MSEFKAMSSQEALAALADLMPDLFYSSLYHQYDDNYEEAHRHALAFHGVAALLVAYDLALPEPFGTIPLRTLAASVLKDIEEEDDDDEDDEPSPWRGPDEPTTPTPVDDEGPWLL